MAVQKITDMTAITGSNTASDDLFLVIDASSNQAKKITREELNNAIEQDVLASIDVTTANIDGGTIDGTTIGGTTPASGTFSTLQVDNFTLNGTELDLSSGDFTLDVAGDISLDADGGDIFLKDAGTTFGEFTNSSTDFVVKSTTSDKDIIFKGNDGGSEISALTLDMSEAGNASFNGTVTANAGLKADNITIDGTEIDLSSGDLTLDVAGDIVLDADGGDVIFKDDGTTFGSATNTSGNLIIKSGTTTALTFSGANLTTAGTLGTTSHLTVGSQLRMPDNTSGKILVGDGTSYQEVAVSGDVTIASSGAVTIANSSVTNAMLAGSIADSNLSTISTANKVDIGALDIDGATDIGADLVNADLIIVDDGANGTERKATFTRVKKLIYSGLSSDLTASDSGAVTVANGAITTAKIGADAVDGTKIADDSIDSEHIVDGSVDTAHIADSNVTTAKIADSNVTTSKIADANVTTAKINDSAVTNAKLAGSIADSKLNTISTAGKVDIGALEIDGATDIGADLVDADLLIVDDGANGTERKSTFTRVKKYINSAISGDATVSDSGALTIANDAVEQSMIADDAVGADQLASSSVVTASIVDDNVTTAKIADLNITTGKIANNAVTAGKIANNTITSSQVDSSIVTPTATQDLTNKTLFPRFGTASNPVVFTVTVASKTSAHPYNGDGSALGYYINGIESPAILFNGADDTTANSEYVYKFDQSDSSNSGHPLLFYLDAGKSNGFSTDVSTSGTPGSSGAFTLIKVSENTPNILYYQCSNHGYMGNHAVATTSTFSKGGNLIQLPSSAGTLVGSGDSGTVTNTMLAGSIANGKLSNSAVNFGGVSVSLGSSDTTPAFDLQDATGLPTSALTGTISNSQLATITTADKVSGASIQIDGATDGTSITIADADKFLIDDNGTTKYVNASQLSTYISSGQVTFSNTGTFTNKTFDANGTGNSISNIEVADFASGVVDTDIASVSGSDDTLASAKAIKAYVDAQANVTGTVTLNGTQTLTNKTIDADNNTLSNIEVDNLKSGVLDTDISSVSGSDDTLASAKAIKTYVDSQTGSGASAGFAIAMAVAL